MEYCHDERLVLVMITFPAPNSNTPTYDLLVNDFSQSLHSLYRISMYSENDYFTKVKILSREDRTLTPGLRLAAT